MEQPLPFSSPPQGELEITECPPPPPPPPPHSVSSRLLHQTRHHSHRLKLCPSHDRACLVIPLPSKYSYLYIHTYLSLTSSFRSCDLPYFAISSTFTNHPSRISLHPSPCNSSSRSILNPSCTTFLIRSPEDFRSVRPHKVAEPRPRILLGALYHCCPDSEHK